MTSPTAPSSPLVTFFNTLGKQKMPFTPQTPGQVRLYSCGPTVYDFAHIGNFRSFIMADTLTRTLTLAGYTVTKVQNITDVGHLVSDADEGEDKIMKKARLEQKDPYAISQFFADAYLEDEALLRILPANHRPRATDYITEQISMTQAIMEAGYAYEANGSVYFRTAQWERYGELSGNQITDLVAGHRVEAHPDKEDPRDFALWKAAPANHLMQWESPWGRGFPGWHIECSAMGNALLPEGIDIHTGGEDNIFPHHECEIAQNLASGHPEIPYWLHAKHLLVEGQKMSKSLGNFFTIRDLTGKGFTGPEIRLALLAAHYRTSLNFSTDGLLQARANIRRLREAHRLLQDVADATTVDTDHLATLQWQFRTALFDDLNTAAALGVTFEVIATALRDRESQSLTPATAAAVVHFLESDFDAIFAVLQPDQTLDTDTITHIQSLIADREACRQAKDWAGADQIRDQLKALGVTLKDEAGRTSWTMQ